MAFTRPKAAQIDFDVTNISDPLLRLNSGQSGSADKDVGIVVERGSDTNVALIYDESADEFVLVNTTEDGTTSGNVTISSYADLQVGTINTATLEIGGTAVTSTAAELNILDGVTATATELNYVSGVTSAIQTQIDSISGGSKHTIQNAGSNLTARTGLNFDGTYLVATDDSGNDQTDVTIGSGVVTTTGTQTLTNKTLTSPNMTSPAISGTTITATAAELNYTDGVTSNIQTQLDAKLASASYTAADVLTKIKTVDGAGSGLDADLLDGISSASFLRSDTSDSITSGSLTLDAGNITVNNGANLQVLLNAADGAIEITRAAGGAYIDFKNSTAEDYDARLQESGGSITLNGNRILTTADEGSGNGLDADTLDGIDSASFLRSDVSDSVATGRVITFNSNDVLETASGDQSALQVYQDTVNADAFMTFHIGGDYAAYFGLKGDINDFAVGGWSMGANYYRVWHAGNDGAGSGLDADTLDGYQPATGATANTIALRDGSGNLSATLFNGTATSARYADLAERYEADADYAIGTVLIFGGEKEVTQSTAKMDRRKAGVVSLEPAYMMNCDLNETVEHAPYVALQGRVPVRVIGEVRKGDLMITSNVPGCAEAWREEGDPRYGSVIGKSLVNKDTLEEELIEVAVGVN